MRLAAQRLGLRVREVSRALRSAPSVAEAEADEARRMSRAECVDAYVKMTSDGLTPPERELARRHLGPDARVLDIGCGAGREALGFLRLGCRVTAVDASAELVAWAERSVSSLDDRERIRFHVMPLSRLAVGRERFDAVFVSSDVYAAIPGRANRVAALARCRALLAEGGVVIFPVTIPTRASRLARWAIDGPRSVARGLGFPAPEAGDRWIEVGSKNDVQFRHRFFSNEELVAEIADAGLAVVDRVTTFWVTRDASGSAAVPRDVPPTAASPASPRGASVAALAADLARALSILPRVELGRRTKGPAPLVAALREEGRKRAPRDEAGRARLRRAIGWADRAVPGGPNCYRRALLAIALDRESADEALTFGLDARRGAVSGHAWVGARGADAARAYDVEVAL